jgi:hypothetical protein
MHLMHLVIALWLIAFAFARPSPPPAPYQNYVVIGLLLTLLAVIPTRASEPPSAWREFYDQPTK